MAFANECTYPRTERLCPRRISYAKRFWTIFGVWVLQTFGDRGFCYTPSFALP